MSSDFWTGALVRLVAENIEQVAPDWQRWDSDTQFKRLLDSDPPTSRTAAQIRKEYEGETPNDKSFAFTIVDRAQNRAIGFVSLWVNSWINGDAFVGIGIGERDYWSKGYGGDALRVMLRFAFDELALYRVALNVFSANTRAIRAYEKVGFKHVGTQREAMLRDGKRIDVIYMDILRREWQQTNHTI